MLSSTSVPGFVGIGSCRPPQLQAEKDEVTSQPGRKVSNSDVDDDDEDENEVAVVPILTKDEKINAAVH